MNMKLTIWTNSDGLHLVRPEKPSILTDIDFDPDALCDQCGEPVISISTDGAHRCTWCVSGRNRRCSPAKKGRTSCMIEHRSPRCHRAADRAFRP